MSNYSSLKATINANVKQNGNQEITGAIMNSVLNAMVDSLGAGYQYKGVATPATNPGTPDYNVFYLASEAGTYTNFGGLVIGDNEVAALVYNGSWSKQTTGAATASEVSQLAQEVDDYFFIADDISGLDVSDGVISTATQKWYAGAGTCIFFPLTPGKKYKVENNKALNANVAVLATDVFGPANTSPAWATGYSSVNVLTPGDIFMFVAPNDAVSLYVRLKDGSDNDLTPDIFTFTSIEDLNGRFEQIEEDIKTLDNDVNGEEVTTTIVTEYNNPGYIKYNDGTIVTPNTWIHSDLIPLSDFVSVEKIVGNASVDAVSFYAGQTYISGINGDAWFYNNKITRADLDGRIPVGTTHLAFSTNSTSYTLKVTTSQTSLIPGLSQRVLVLENAEKRGMPTKALHFSFDDTISAFYDIAHNNRASIFDNAFFGALKTLHETYGAVFSCYCFLDYINVKYVSKITTIANPDTTAVYYLSATDGIYSPGWYVYKNSVWTAFGDVSRDDYVIYSLSDFPSTYATEFSANSDWLKFGLHCKDGMVNYGSASVEDATTDYNSFISSILSITGTPECVDTVVRLQNFSGSLNACRGFRDCDLGVQGFLCNDYSETSGGAGGTSGGYYLTTTLAEAVWKKGQIYDYAERLHFYVSGLRMDSTTSANMPTYLAKFLTASKWEQTAMIEMYCHENQMYRVSDNTITSDYIARIQAVCSWAVAKKFNFAYQMDKIRQSF